jgi:hypothetical protein
MHDGGDDESDTGEEAVHGLLLEHAGRNALSKPIVGAMAMASTGGSTHYRASSTTSASAATASPICQAVWAQ